MAKKKFALWKYVDDGKDRVATMVATPNPKKITGSRFPAILGLNSWKSPFGAWCEITRVAEEEFVDNKYTVAGKTIEPKLIEFCKEHVSPNIVDPSEFYESVNPEQKMRYDFFQSDPIFGGMWDGLVMRKGKPYAVIECKTSSRPQDWVDGVPLHYLYQGLLYAHLLGVDTLYVPVAWLEDKDYENPEDFVCTEENTRVYEIQVSDYDIEGAVSVAREWWNEYVVTGVSPRFDEKKDKSFLDIMRRNEVDSEDLDLLTDIVDELESQIEYAKEVNGLAELERKLADAKEILKTAMIDHMGENDNKVVSRNWVVKKSERRSVDTARLKADGLYEEYSKVSVVYKLEKEKS